MISAAAAAEPPIYARARAVAHYTGLMREMIGQLKYADRHEARKLMGRWLAGAARDLLDDCDMIVPVPMHPRRLMWRRFNQAGLIAGELARISGRPFEPTVLIRVRATRSQVGLTRNQRLRNLAGAFAVPARRRSLVHGRRVLLVDDVITTGTTLNAAARVLLRAGASEVDAAALALVTPESRIGL